VQLINRAEHAFAIDHDSIGGQQLSAGIRPQPHVQCDDGGFIRHTLLLRGQRHVDVELAFLSTDSKREEKEYEQLEHDVNHRCHLQLDLLILSGARVAELHGDTQIRGNGPVRRPLGPNFFLGPQRELLKLFFLA